MVAAASTRPASDGQTRIADIAYSGEPEGGAYTRADLVFRGVDHAQTSYEVRIYLNNPQARADTPRTEAQGYAGRFHVFGHGGCFGDIGHCDIPSPSNDPTDLRPPHQLTPLTTYVTITPALRRLLLSGERLATVCLVPIVLPPLRADRGPAPELFKFESVELHLYLTPLDAGSQA
jgi:tyrosinase